MVAVISIMIAGMVVGYFIRNREVLVKLNDKLTMWSIYLLLFLMGISIGANRTIVGNMANLGVTALIITVGGVLGSLLVAWIGYRIWFKKREQNHAE